MSGGNLLEAREEVTRRKEGGVVSKGYSRRIPVSRRSHSKWVVP